MRPILIALALFACNHSEPAAPNLDAAPDLDAAPNYGDCLISVDVSALVANGPNQASSEPVTLPGPARVLVVSADREDPEASVSLVRGAETLASVVPPGVDFLDGESGDMAIVLETGAGFSGSIAVSEATIGFDCPLP